MWGTSREPISIASHGARFYFLSASGGVDCGELRVGEAAFYLLVLRCHGLSVICEADGMTMET